jgi:hypothetical protein
MDKTDERILETLAVAGHGGGVFLSFIALVFHLLRERTIFDRDVALNAFLLWYHGNAVAKHAKRL